MPLTTRTVGPFLSLLSMLGLTACGAAPAPPVEAPEAPAAAALPAEEEPAWAVIDVLAAAPTEILVDGKPAGTTPITGYKVAPGAHDVTYVDAVNGNRTMGVTLEPGDSRVVTSDPAPAASEALVPAPTPKKK